MFKLLNIIHKMYMYVLSFEMIFNFFEHLKRKIFYFFIVNQSKFGFGGRGIFSNIFRGGGREQVRGEFGGLSHVSFDLHLTLHESSLRVEFSKTDIIEVIISHGECGISTGGLSNSDRSGTIL